MAKAADWKIINEAESRGPSGFMKIVTRRYELPDGRQSDWDLLHGGKTVAVLALTPDNKVLLVRQFRPGPGLILDEMPGGYVDAGETPLEAAKRELLEESGYEGDVEIVANTWLAANATTRRYVAVARNCRKAREPENVGDEFCELIFESLENFRKQLSAGELTDTDLGYLALDYAGII